MTWQIDLETSNKDPDADNVDDGESGTEMEVATSEFACVQSDQQSNMNGNGVNNNNIHVCYATNQHTEDTEKEAYQMSQPSPLSANGNAGHSCEKSVEKDSTRTKNGCSRCCSKVSNFIIGKFETGFFRLGKLIGSYPVITILLVCLLSGLCCIGLLRFTQENRGEELWIPEGSETIKHQKWVNNAFPAKSRILRILAESTGSNILTVEGIKAVLQTHKELLLVKNGTKNDWENMCFRQGPFCLMSGILEIWGFNETIINALNNSAILDKINQPSIVSPVTGRPIYVSTLLGSVVKSGGKIQQAKVALSTYFLKRQEIFDKSVGRRVDDAGDKFEEEFTTAMKKGFAGLNVYFFSESSYRQASGDSIQGDIQLLSIGYILIILYLAIMLGKFSGLEQKAWLAVGGVACVGLSIGVSFGLSSAFGVFYGPVHSVLPFLILGIGVDDIFVIVQSWDTLAKYFSSDTPIPIRIANTMKLAGVAITVTSMTDMIAFLIGSTTILPALRSFCIYAGIGILSVFFITCTFFSACLTIDARRIKVRRNACCCCFVVPEERAKPRECAKKSYLNYFFEKIYSKYLLTVPAKILVLVATCAFLGVGIYGVTQLEQKFDPIWFLPSDSDAAKYQTSLQKHFPSEGILASVYVGNVNYFAHQTALETLRSKVVQNKYVNKESVVYWYEGYKDWLKARHVSNPNVTADGVVLDESTFYAFLKTYLQTSGSSFLKDVQFKNISSSNEITASRFTFTHVAIESSRDEIDALDSIQSQVSSVKFGGQFTPFSYTRQYFDWETNKVIATELFRNLILASVCVFLVTLFLIANIWVSLMVFTCVVFTLVSVSAMMHFWGLTVDTVTTIMLILAIGLCVDYAAHVGHAFMVARKGSRTDRAAHALAEIGPAVFNGGVSTFLAFILLGASNSYVFQTFFKVFLLVVVFGQFHGLVYFPVLLSLIGPAPYATDSEINDSSVSPSASVRKGNTDKEAAFKEQNGNVDASTLNTGYQKSMEDINRIPSK